ncbi:MAG: YkgJ family cysteine cluster protein [Gemmatimonadales bacterium]|nr:YkgJ family cysteine cluster protein [Gemmatimonadales bacterium]
MPKASVPADQRHICQKLCKARCCRYITVQIKAPRLKADFDEIGWFLAHENISVYFHGRRWHVEVRTRCEHLTRSNLCSAYETRPLVCRDYDIEACEYPARPRHDLHFDTQQEFEGWWARKRERERRRRRKRARAARARRT